MSSAPKKNMPLQKKIFFVCFVAALIVGAWYGDKLTTSETRVHEVVLSDNGFSPGELTIKKGDSVRFLTTKNNSYWPASDEHPAHGAYSSFDPKRPLQSDEVWEFTFDQVGSWGYHDHLYSFHKGVIVVE